MLIYPTLPTPPDGALRNVLTLDGTPLTSDRPHGQAIAWFRVTPPICAASGYSRHGPAGD